MEAVSQLKDSVNVFFSHCSGTKGCQSYRIFRLVDGSYVSITSTEQGNEIADNEIPLQEVEVYKQLWKQLGNRAINHEERNGAPDGIRYASHEFFEMSEDIIMDLEDADDRVIELH